eukprot:TRINITY_DN10373_c0_g1_i1.p1 TRINITY_DN10373_c0_g1~~TRINITY_DN10373_c0_g1_i1.p1  ORF type:complete len:67 (+),score=22.83 TRINITY_DN10373_c0_g1_i1:264-464(+)
MGTFVKSSQSKSKGNSLTKKEKVVVVSDPNPHASLARAEYKSLNQKKKKVPTSVAARLRLPKAHRG